MNHFCEGYAPPEASEPFDLSDPTLTQAFDNIE
jgi:hypothetical protein